jgi:hypothetical protein
MIPFILFSIFTFIGLLIVFVPLFVEWHEKINEYKARKEQLKN